jgi:hypothetical protein
MVAVAAAGSWDRAFDVDRRRPFWEECPLMYRFEVGPGGYDSFWCNARPRPKRRLLGAGLARFGVLVVLLAGSGLALSYFQAQGGAFGAHAWEQE